MEGQVPQLPNPFTQATKVDPKLKLLLYGGPATGKSYTALSAPGPVAVIDTEAGTVWYAGRPGLSEFHRLGSKTYAEIKHAIEYLRDDGTVYRDGKPTADKFQTLVIDPITIVYAVLMEAQSLKVTAKRGEDADLAPGDWGKIKRPYKQLMTEIINLPMHVVITAREADQMTKQGSDFVVTGQKADTEKSALYDFDTVLRLHKSANQRLYTVIKDRSDAMLPEGETFAIPNVLEKGSPFMAIFGEYLKASAGQTGVARGDVSDEQAAQVALVDGTLGAPAKELASPGLIKALHDAMAALGQDAEALRVEKKWPPYEEWERDKVVVMTQRALAKATNTGDPQAAGEVKPAADGSVPEDQVGEHMAQVMSNAVSASSATSSEASPGSTTPTSPESSATPSSTSPSADEPASDSSKAPATALSRARGRRSAGTGSTPAGNGLPKPSMTPTEIMDHAAAQRAEAEVVPGSEVPDWANGPQS